jgi:hypothetical protein
MDDTDAPNRHWFRFPWGFTENWSTWTNGLLPSWRISSLALGGNSKRSIDSSSKHYTGDVPVRYGLSIIPATAVRPTLGEVERNTLPAAVAQCEQELYADARTAGNVLTDTLPAVYHRRAVRPVLVDHDYLDITRRSIPQPIHSTKSARIK